MIETDIYINQKLFTYPFNSLSTNDAIIWFCVYMVIYSTTLFDIIYLSKRRKSNGNLDVKYSA